MPSGLGRLGLGGLALIFAGCQEDNEAAIKAQESKSSDAQVKGAGPRQRPWTEWPRGDKRRQKTTDIPAQRSDPVSAWIAYERPDPWGVPLSS